MDEVQIQPKDSYRAIYLARFLDSSVTTGGRWLVGCPLLGDQPIVLLLCVWVNQTTVATSPL